MNIIICGAGRVGFTIAKLLTEQNSTILSTLDQEDFLTRATTLRAGITTPITIPSVTTSQFTTVIRT